MVDFHAYDPRYSIFEHFHENKFFVTHLHFPTYIMEIHLESRKSENLDFGHFGPKKNIFNNLDMIKIFIST